MQVGGAGCAAARSSAGEQMVSEGGEFLPGRVVQRRFGPGHDSPLAGELLVRTYNPDMHDDGGSVLMDTDPLAGDATKPGQRHRSVIATPSDELDPVVVSGVEDIYERRSRTLQTCVPVGIHVTGHRFCADRVRGILPAQRDRDARRHSCNPRQVNPRLKSDQTSPSTPKCSRTRSGVSTSAADPAATIRPESSTTRSSA